MSNYHAADENDGKLSECCQSPLRLDRCTGCGEYSGPIEEDE